MKRPGILVVGSLNMDLTLYDAPSAPGYGDLAQCSMYAYSPGGKGANQACALAKLGAAAALVGQVGDDSNGRRILEELVKYDLDVSHVVRRSEAQTGLVVICAEPDGRVRQYGVLGANMSLSEHPVREALDAGRFDMVLMQLEMPLDTACRAYQLARERGIPVMLDAGPAMDVPIERFSGVDILSPNEAETRALTQIQVTGPESAAAAARVLYRRACPRYVILKLGDQGVYLYDGVRGELCPPFPVHAVDSTAAGDTFNAALCVKYCAGEEIRAAIDFAQAAAAIAVTRKGALPSLPTLGDVQRFLDPAPR